MRTLTRACRLAAVLALTLAVRHPASAAGRSAAGDPSTPAPGHPHGQESLQWPQDEGAHPAWKTEWWYLTGWTEDSLGQPRGFQITFFRNRGPADASHGSAFAPHQLLLAHAALSDPAQGRILHDELAARSGFGLAESSTGRMDVHIEQWHLRRDSADVLSAKMDSTDFALDLRLEQNQPALLQGVQGFSQKGREARAFSWYYSLPQLRLTGRLRSGAGKAPLQVHGTAWLDHEWSDAYVSPGAVGWDWTGLNFSDGSALMAFRMRDAGGATLWSSATWRNADGQSQLLGNHALAFLPGRRWKSPATGALYPVEWTLRWPGHEVHLQPLLDGQEMDTRTSTGTAYWEGAVTVQGSALQPLGRGYLELTGYWKPLQF